MKRSAMKRKPPPPRACPVCGEEFVPRKTGQRLCSHACVRRAGGEAAGRVLRKTRPTCRRPGCDRPLRTGVYYCSPACQYADAARKDSRRSLERLRFVCETCGEEFEREPGRGTGRFCSIACLHRRTRNTAPNPPRPVAVRPPPVRHTRKAWNAGKMKCVRCGKRAQRHHAIYESHVIAADPFRRYDVANRVGLCPVHHRQHHDRIDVVPIAALPDHVIAFAADLLGPGAAYVYLRRYYAGDDPRVDALVRDVDEDLAS